MTSAIPMPASAEIAMQTAKSAQQASPKTQKSAEEFSGMFMSEMLSHMFEGVDVDPMFGGGSGEKMFRSLLTQEYGKQMSQGAGGGITGQIQTMMLKIQEQQHKG